MNYSYIMYMFLGFLVVGMSSFIIVNVMNLDYLYLPFSALMSFGCGGVLATYLVDKKDEKE